ncbi:MAG: hypothetical protein J1F39_00895 [Clostridiales bacterium]|nr:hypothetical protein [Clostridiales bacterium]
MKKIDKIFKWIVFGVFILHLLAFFMPIYSATSQTSYSDPEVILSYLYSSSSIYLLVYFSELLIPIVAIVFLFANFKSSRPFFFGLMGTYMLNGIFTILSLSRMVLDNTSSYYDYAFQYGYYIYIVTLVFLFIAVISSFIVYLVSKSQNANEDAEASRETYQESKIDVLRKRIELLDDLKRQGVLTEREYDEKRSEIIKDLKI